VSDPEPKPAQQPRAIGHLIVTIVVSLGISAIFAGVVAGRSEPDYRKIPVPNDYLVALDSLLLLFASFMTFITSERITKRRMLLTLIGWAAFGVCLIVMLTWR